MTINGTRQLGLAGFFATAVAFGPARNGYGLFLPDIREEFGLSTVILGSSPTVFMQATWPRCSPSGCSPLALAPASR